MPKGLSAVEGANGQIGSGGYILNWDCEVTGQGKLLSGYRDRGMANAVWDHTQGMFDKVEKLNGNK
jgi:hypothetical protein